MFVIFVNRNKAVAYQRSCRRTDVCKRLSLVVIRVLHANLKRMSMTEGNV
jgi:hypothetical protein